MLNGCMHLISQFHSFTKLKQINEDFMKLFRLAITYPISPEFFFYSYIIGPCLNSRANAWSSWPSTFDSKEIAASYGIGLSLSAVTGSPGISASYVVSTGSVYSGSNRVTISIVADIVLNGTSVTTPYSLVATLTSGATVNASISASGSFTKIQVGSIG
jgi:hypothetical protein